MSQAKKKESAVPTAGAFTAIDPVTAMKATGKSKGTGGFNIVRPYRRVRWRKLAEADVPAMKRRGDIHGVLSHLDDVAFGDVCNAVDASPAMMKAFSMGQFSIQYLLHTQKVIREGAEQCDSRRENARKKLQSVKRRLKMQREEYRQLLKESKRTKKVLKSHAAVLGALSPELAGVPPEKLGSAVVAANESRKEELSLGAQEELRKARLETERERQRLARERAKMQQEREEEAERAYLEKQNFQRDVEERAAQERQELEKLRQEKEEEEQKRLKEIEHRKHKEEAKRLKLEAEEKKRRQEQEQRENAKRLERKRKMEEEADRKAKELERLDAERHALAKRREEERELLEKEAAEQARKLEARLQEEKAVAEKAKKDAEEKARKQKEMADAMVKRREDKKREIEAAKAAAKARQGELERKIAERDKASADPAPPEPQEGNNSKKKRAVVNFDDEDSNNDSIESIPSLVVKEALSPTKKSEIAVVEDTEDEIATILERRLQNQHEDNAITSIDSKLGEDPGESGEEDEDDYLARQLEKRKAARMEKDKNAREERKALANALPELGKGDIRKYEKAFGKWDEGDGGVTVENMRDLLDTLPGKLKWSPSENEFNILLQKMGAQGKPQDYVISLAKYLQGLRSRKGIEDGNIGLGDADQGGGREMQASEEQAGGGVKKDSDIQDTLDLLDASSFGDDWDESLEDSVDVVVDLSAEDIE